VRERIEGAAEKSNDGSPMRRLLIPVLSALLLATLAACESASSGGALAVALDAPRRCAHCGWIESKHEIRPDIVDPRAAPIYEYTVRMADGSSSVFREKLTASWRLGERLVFIDGARTSN
jgi:hypothetical protein